MSSNNSNLPVSIQDIDSSLGGTKLNSDLSECFEEAYLKFLRSKSKQENAAQIINDMSKLLAVSDENLSEIKNQSAFKRAWNTVTGKNKKLERITNSNLLKVQKGALFFLQNIAETNDQMMETVSKALQRVEDIQVENVKIKGYLIRLVKGYNDRISQIESRLEQHDEAITNIIDKSNNFSYLFFGVGVVIILSIVSYIVFEDKSYWMIFTAFILAGGLLAFISLNRKRNGNSQNGGHVVTINKSLNLGNNMSKIQIENSELIPKIQELMLDLYVSYVGNNVLENPYQQFFDQNNILNELYAELGKTINENKSAFGNIVRKILSVEPEPISNILANLRNSASMICDYHNKLMSAIQNDYLPKSIGIDILSSLDYRFQEQLYKDLESAITPYKYLFDEIATVRRHLLGDSGQFYNITDESSFSENAKAIMEGFTFGIWRPSSNDIDFLNRYTNNIYEYGRNWDNLISVVNNSVRQLNITTYENAITNAVGAMSPILEQFNKDELSLKLLHDELVRYTNENEK